MYSEALRIMDENTVQYMIESQQKEIEAQQKLLEEKDYELKRLQLLLQEKSIE